MCGTVALKLCSTLAIELCGTVAFKSCGTVALQSCGTLAPPERSEASSLVRSAICPWCEDDAVNIVAMMYTNTSTCDVGGVIRFGVIIYQS